MRKSRPAAFAAPFLFSCDAGAGDAHSHRSAGSASFCWFSFLTQHCCQGRGTQSFLEAGGFLPDGILDPGLFQHQRRVGAAHHAIGDVVEYKGKLARITRFDRKLGKVKILLFTRKEVKDEELSVDLESEFDDEFVVDYFDPKLIRTGDTWFRTSCYLE